MYDKTLTLDACFQKYNIYRDMIKRAAAVDPRIPRMPTFKLSPSLLGLALDPEEDDEDELLPPVEEALEPVLEGR